MDTMGNSAIIRTENGRVGIYVHWGGDQLSIMAYLTFCRMKGYRLPEEDCYGWARLCAVMANSREKGLSVGVDSIEELERTMTDNGVYTIRGWEIIDREPPEWNDDLRREFMYDIIHVNLCMPRKEQFDLPQIAMWLQENMSDVFAEGVPA